jgi:hypothetical protein
VEAESSARWVILHSMPVLGTNPHAQTSNNYQGFLLVENSQVYDIPIIIFIHADGFFSHEDFH